MISDRAARSPPCVAPLVIGVGLLCAAIAPAQAQRITTHFAPDASAPDHVVTMVSPSPRGIITYTVVHRGAWTRIDRDEGPQRTTSYATPGETTDVDIYRNAAGEVTSFQLMRDRERRPYVDTEPRNTGERQTLLGESCTVWNVRRTRDTGLAQLSCLTDDGIELWRKYAGQYGETLRGEATRVERRPVAPDEVRPPLEFLALARWARSERGSIAPTGPDHETVMRGTRPRDPSEITRTVRRRNPWIYVEETAGPERRRLTLTNVVTGLKLEFRNNDEMVGDRLSISTSEAYYSSTKPSLPTRDHDEVLGESCQWWVPVVGASTSGTRDCRTKDGITLKEETWSPQARHGFTAVHVARRTIEEREVAPPAEILDPRHWGLD